MSGVASKNLFELLGNDDGDSDTPSAPVKTVDKKTTGTTKRNVEPVAPSKPATATSARRGPGGNEGAFRDKNAGSASNYRKPTDEASRGAPRGGRGARERGGRGSRYPRTQDDRHSKGQATGSEKQAAQSWGATEGEAEKKDEDAGEEMAKSELKDAVAEDAAPVDEPEPEPEDKSVSYSDYLAQLAEKKLALGEELDIRKPNEGAKMDKKWASARALVKDDDEDFISGTSGKTKRERERKAKQVVEIDQRYIEPERPRGGRGGDFRGGRGGGRGGPRGGRGDSRGGPRGGRGGDFRGGRGGAPRDTTINTNDVAAFPSLG